MRLKARIDGNQASIVAALRARGWTVQSLAAVGKGVPDLLVGAHGCNVLLEVKAGAAKLRAVQEAWHRDWRGQAAVVRTADEAIATVLAVVERVHMDVMFNELTKVIG